MIRDYDYMCVIKEKHVGQWLVELAHTLDGTYEIIMTRSTDCLYDFIVEKHVDDALNGYEKLKRVRQIMDYVKNNNKWYE